MRRRIARTIIIPWERRGVFRGIRFGRWILRVLAAIALVTTVYAIYRYTDVGERTRSTRATIARVRHAVLAFKADFGRCPSDIAELVAPREHEPYLRGVPLDGWGRTLDFQCPGRKEQDTADIRSRGPDGTWYGRDEID